MNRRDYAAHCEWAETAKRAKLPPATVTHANRYAARPAPAKRRRLPFRLLAAMLGGGAA